MSEGMEKLADKLQSLWSVENQLVTAIPPMYAKATDFGLNKVLSYHFAETLQHRTAVESICKQLEINPQGDVDEHLATILSENELMLSDGDNINELIILGALRVEQYEISAYQSAADEAMRARLSTLARRLLLTLEEEKQACNKLTFLLKTIRSNRPHELELNMHV
jgi:ferritin-like metal-binding protein YciE